MLIVSILPMMGNSQKEVTSYLYHGPIPCIKPIMADSVDVNGATFDENELMKSFPISDKYFVNAQTIAVDTAKYTSFKSDKQKYTIYFFKTYIVADRFVKGKIEVKGNGIFEVYVNGAKKKDKSTFDSLPKEVQKLPAKSIN